MINNVVITGRLVADPELRYTPNGVAVANFTVAVNRSFVNAEGEREADFINCVAWKGTAETIANHLNKGTLAGYQGALQTRSYENSEGQRVWVTEVVVSSMTFLESKKEQEKTPAPKGNRKGYSKRK
jgi:single-strand DNA-binding protein